jgi:preprotein translocase subunit SecB
MNETKKSAFQFKGFIIKKSTIELNSSEKDRKLSIQITPTGVINKKEKVFELTLGLKVNNKGDSAYVNVEALGTYSFEDDLEDSMLSNFFYLNAPAILFPYLRSYISTLTTLSGIPPINLPTLNLVGFREQLKKKTTMVD